MAVSILRSFLMPSLRTPIPIRTRTAPISRAFSTTNPASATFNQVLKVRTLLHFSLSLLYHPFHSPIPLFPISPANLPLFSGLPYIPTRPPRRLARPLLRQSPLPQRRLHESRHHGPEKTELRTAENGTYKVEYWQGDYGVYTGGGT